jgi:hypothetical protein
MKERSEFILFKILFYGYFLLDCLLFIHLRLKVFDIYGKWYAFMKINNYYVEGKTKFNKFVGSVI